MTSKWVGDAVGKEGIYSAWIAMRRYPWLPPATYRDAGETGATLMKPLARVVVIRDAVTTVCKLRALLAAHDFHGFSVIDSHNEFVGYATKQELGTVLERLQLDDTGGDLDKTCTFSATNRLRVDTLDRVDLSDALEASVIQLQMEVPQELVVNMFQKLNLRQILFTRAGKLTGLVTKRVVVDLFTRQFPHAAVLCEHPPHRQ
ncbi:hypothetical protein HYPSUDRAFT_208768 [Hypholoma sublateritium FD-334 SS-4]|uniref:CBS domain-containing protein n=1 Tax=Hypholoma sublateritium (strain FD-334 SS-4) TaxID=945553 RepID=A0A0D2KI99_HYPSF|nr:hypothetical protein HYPSUDRAFT_208768 [Hypholoma sublateritium FD-334 SS-4]